MGKSLYNVELGKNGRNRYNVWDYAGQNALGATSKRKQHLHPTVKPAASLMFSPAVAMAAIYLFGVDLTKLPFLPTDIPYRVPTKFVQVIAISLSFSFSLSFAAWLGLRLHDGPKPDIDGFMQQFFRELSRDEK